MSPLSGVKRAGRLALQIALPAAFLYGAVVLTDALIDARPEVARTGKEEPAVPVEVAAVRHAENRPVIRAFGEVVPARTVELRALVAGPLVAVHPDLKVGSHVKQGEELLAVDPFPFEGALVEAEAALEEARARVAEIGSRIALEETAIARVEEQVAFAERDLARAERLLASGAITEQALDGRRLTVSERQQRLEQRRHTLAAEQARLEQARADIARLTWRRDQAARELADTRLVAPFDAVIADETVEVGRMVSANDMAVRLYEENALEVRFVLSELAFGRLVTAGEPIEGRTIRVVWRIGDRPPVYEARIERTSAEIEAARGGIGMLARLSIPQNAVAPRPGAFVEVEVPGVAHADSVRLSGTALYGSNVFVVVDGRLERRTVRLLARDGEAVIVAGDLADGDVVLTSRLTEVGEGLKVEPTNDVPRIEPDATAGIGTRGRS